MADDIEMIRRHYGDFTGLYDPAQAVAHVRILLAERDEMVALFEAKCRRMEAPTALWQQEDPAAREGVLPDLGYLLKWLMDQRNAALIDAAKLRLVLAFYGQVPECGLYPDPPGHRLRLVADVVEAARAVGAQWKAFGRPPASSKLKALYVATEALGDVPVVPTEERLTAGPLPSTAEAWGRVGAGGPDVLRRVAGNE